MLADSGVFGADLLVWLVLALGGAMVVGNVLALFWTPPANFGTRSQARGKRRGQATTGAARKAGAKRTGAAARSGKARTGRGGRGGQGARAKAQAPLPQAPLGRTLTMIAIGALAVVWSAATLLSR